MRTESTQSRGNSSPQKPKERLNYHYPVSRQRLNHDYHGQITMYTKNQTLTSSEQQSRTKTRQPDQGNSQWLTQKEEITKGEQWLMKSSGPVLLCFYGCLKTQKPHVLLYPIVSLPGSPTCNITKLTKKLGLLTEGDKYTINSPLQCFQESKTWQQMKMKSWSHSMSQYSFYSEIWI